MRLIQKILVLLLLTGFYAPSFAAVNALDISSCAVFSADDSSGDKKDGDAEEDEEPDCE